MEMVQLLFSPKGRLGRAKYFLTSLIVDIVLCVIIFLPSDSGYLVFSILSAYINIILGIKRLHDINMSGWFMILFSILFPLMFLLWFIPGTKGSNKFGEQEQPKVA